MAAIPDLLRRSRTIAVVGLSSKRFRPSYGVAEYMQEQGYRIIPVNPNESEVLGEKTYRSIEDVPEHIDIVDIFRRSEFVGPSWSRQFVLAPTPSGCRRRCSRGSGPKSP